MPGLARSARHGSGPGLGSQVCRVSSSREQSRVSRGHNLGLCSAIPNGQRRARRRCRPRAAALARDPPKSERLLILMKQRIDLFIDNGTPVSGRLASSLTLMKQRTDFIYQQRDDDPPVSARAGAAPAGM